MQHNAKKLMMSLICFLSHGKWNFRTAYNTIYQGQGRSSLFRDIVREVFGDEFPEDADPFSFVTLSDLNKMADVLHLNPGDWFADIACGRGGPGMWVARKTGTNVRGVDISEDAIASANQRIPAFGLDSRSRFSMGSFYDTGIDTGSCDGAISVDALWLSPDRNRALREIGRILKPGTRFVFTTWDGNIPFMPDDHKQNLTDSGFAVDTRQS
ncbi:MAG: class I SAM-dependent methyltransferase [Desulfobacteraceae bacterium]|nr:class I SAM-dependent methyltransferase [Desulfobacteraceae bacterium]